MFWVYTFTQMDPRPRLLIDLLSKRMDRLIEEQRRGMVSGDSAPSALQHETPRPSIVEIIKRIKAQPEGAEVVVSRAEMDVIESLWKAPEGWLECAAWSRTVKVANG